MTGIVVQHALCCQNKVLTDKACHALQLLVQLARGDARRNNLLRVDISKAIRALVHLLRYKEIREIDQLFDKRQQHERCHQLEGDVEHRNLYDWIVRHQ